VDSNYLPLWKTLDTPFVSLDQSHVELFSLLALLGLCLAAMLVRRRRQLVRHGVQLVSLGIFFYVVYSCLGVFGMIRNALHGTTLLGTVFTEAFFWMALPVVVLGFSLTAGPYFCGWICPTGALQEFAILPREALTRWLGRRWPRALAGARPTLAGTLLLALVLAGFLGAVFYLGGTKRFYVEDSSLYWGAALVLLVFMVRAGRADDQALRALRAVSFWIIVGSALAKSMIVSPVHFAFADVRDPASALTTLVLVVASLFLGRAWCRYVCPWGYLMGCTHRVSRLRVESAGGCQGCDTCTGACRVGAVQRGVVRVDACQMCLACVDTCPRGALKVVDRWAPRGGRGGAP
jgi:polyferredoxin